VSDLPAAAEPRRRQRLAGYAVLFRERSGGRELLLTRISARGHHAGAWTLPGGGVEHGEAPRTAVEREVVEETGLAIRAGRLLDVHDSHFTGRAPDGVVEDFHGVHLLFAAEVLAEPGAGLEVTEAHGTTDAVAWIPVDEVSTGRIEVLDVVRHSLEL